jgi:uncharacterized protein YjbJ (UPF0337 family)
VHFRRLVTGVSRLSSDGNADIRGQVARPDISPRMGARRPLESRSRGHPETTDYTCVLPFPLWDEVEAYVGNGQFCSDLKRPREYKSENRRGAIRAPTKPRRDMKPSTKDKIKGSLHEAKGAIKEEVGKVTNDRNLESQRESRKEGGRGSTADRCAKKTVAKLTRRSKELKTG